MPRQQEPPNSLGLFMPDNSPTMSELYGPPSSSSYGSFQIVTPNPYIPLPLDTISPYMTYPPVPMQLLQPQYHPTIAPTDLFPSLPEEDSSIPPTTCATPCSDHGVVVDLEMGMEPEVEVEELEVTDTEPVEHTPTEPEGTKKKRSRTAQACEKCRIRKARVGRLLLSYQAYASSAGSD